MATTVLRSIAINSEVDRANSSKIRVVHIIDRLVIGGPTKYAIWLASEIDPSKFEGHLISGTAAFGECDVTESAYKAGIRPIIIEEFSREIGWRDLLAFAKLLKQLFKLRPDVVHTHKSKAGVLGRIAALLYKWLTPSALWLRPKACRVVHTFHGHVFHGYFGTGTTRLFIQIERFLARFCTDRIITLSPQQRRDICVKYRVAAPDRVVVIPLGVEIDRLIESSRGLRFEYQISADEVVIGAVGRLCEVKNFELLLRAFAQVRDDVQLPKSRLVIIGDGHLRESLESLAGTLGIGDRVIFTGFRNDVGVLYPQLDIVALTSVNEGTPTTLIEGMLYGLPVVATAVGGVVDLMGLQTETTPGYTVWEHGITAASGDLDNLTRALALLAQNGELRHKMGAAGQAFAVEMFGKERLLRDIQLLYSGLTA